MSGLTTTSCITGLGNHTVEEFQDVTQGNFCVAALGQGGLGFGLGLGFGFRLRFRRWGRLLGWDNGLRFGMNSSEELQEVSDIGGPIDRTSGTMRALRTITPKFRKATMRGEIFHGISIHESVGKSAPSARHSAKRGSRSK